MVQLAAKYLEATLIHVFKDFKANNGHNEWTDEKSHHRQGNKSELMEFLEFKSTVSGITILLHGFKFDTVNK